MNALILSGISWHDTFQRHQQIALNLADRGYNVFFVNSIPSSKFSIKKVIDRVRNKIWSSIDVNSNNSYLNEKITLLSMNLLFPGLITDYINGCIIKSNLKKLSICFDIVIVYLPITNTQIFLKNIKYKKLIYDCVRYFEGWGGYQKNISRIEADIAVKADYILCDSYFLKKHLRNKSKTDDKIYQILPQINTNLIVSPVKHIEHIYTLGYIGTLGTHNDVKLIKKLLQKYKILLYGINEILELESNPNFINKGYYNSLTQLQSDVRRECDGLIIPYFGNMNGVIPAKLPLCISIGLPIFISDFYDSRYLSDLLYVYSDYESLIKQIQSFKKDEWMNKYSEGLLFLDECRKSDYNSIFNNIL